MQRAVTLAILLRHITSCFNVLLCLVYKLKFIMGTYGQKFLLYPGFCYSRFQASTKDLAMCTLHMRGKDCTNFCLVFFKFIYLFILHVCSCAHICV